MEIGSTLNFGGIKWIVLENQKNKTLIITEQIIEQRDYHDKKAPVDWENSEIRHYLNHGFLEKLGSGDQQKILSTANRNGDNPWYGSRGGNETVDKIFLLSLDEVVRLYFGDGISKTSFNTLHYATKSNEGGVRPALWMKN